MLDRSVPTLLSAGRGREVRLEKEIMVVAVVVPVCVNEPLCAKGLGSGQVTPPSVLIQLVLLPPLVSMTAEFSSNQIPRAMWIKSEEVETARRMERGDGVEYF